MFNHPLPLVRGEAALAVRADAAALMLVLCVTLAGSVLGASFAAHLLRERRCGFRRLQALAGAPVTAFWAANYAADLLAFSVPAAGTVALIAAAGSTRLPSLQGARLGALAALLWAFGGAALSLTYALHPLFSDEMRALQRLNSLYFLVGYLGFLLTWTLDLVVRLARPQGLAPVAAALEAGLRALSPHYNLARGLYDVHASYSAGGAGSGGLPPLPPVPPGPGGGGGSSDPFARATWGATMAHLAAQALVYGALAVAADAGAFTPLLARLRAALAVEAPTPLEPPLPPAGNAGSGGGADVAAERAAVEARRGCGPRECSVREPSPPSKQCFSHCCCPSPSP